MLTRVGFVAFVVLLGFGYIGFLLFPRFVQTELSWCQAQFEADSLIAQKAAFFNFSDFSRLDFWIPQGSAVIDDDYNVGSRFHRGALRLDGISASVVSNKIKLPKLSRRFWFCGSLRSKINQSALEVHFLEFIENKDHSYSLLKTTDRSYVASEVGYWEHFIDKFQVQEDATHLEIQILQNPSNVNTSVWVDRLVLAPQAKPF